MNSIHTEIEKAISKSFDTDIDTVVALALLLFAYKNKKTMLMTDMISFFINNTDATFEDIDNMLNNETTYCVN